MNVSIDKCTSLFKLHKYIYIYIYDLHIVWLDLANAFGSLPHSTLNKLFESLPLPAHTSTILKDMYTNTICEYKDFMVQPTSGVR